MFKELKLTITHLSWHFSQFDSYLTSKFAYISILYKYQPSLSSFSLRTYQHCPLHFELFSWNPSNFFYSSRALFETTSYSFGHHQISVLWLLWEEKKKIVNLYTGTKYTKTLRAYFLKSLPERSNRSLVSLYI